MALTASAESESKRGSIFIIVIAIHAVGLWVVESGLSKSIVEMVTGPVETKMIEEVKAPEDVPPPPPPPEIAPPPPFIPPPEVMVQTQVQSNAIQTVTNERPPVVAPPVMAPPKPAIPSTNPRVSKRARSPDEYYPAASNRDNETGSVIIRCYVRVDGRCSETSVSTSSGFPRLDEAAVKYANEGIRFDAGTTEGKPAPMWYQFKVTFKQLR
jgi:protein TonB